MAEEQDPSLKPEEDLEGDDEEAMAALMGFSTFGSQPLSKKRKYNPKTDAMIDGQELENVDRGGKRGKGSGGNNIPLGKMRVLGTSSQGEKDLKLRDANEITDGAVNPDEIEIDIGDDDGDVFYEGEGKPADRTPVVPLSTAQNGGSNTNSTTNPITMNKSLTSPRRSELNSVQQQIDAITTRDSYVPRSPPRPEISGNSSSSLPPKPNFNMNRNNGHGRGGQRNELWYIGYFDPSFLENPWEELEREMGLSSRGQWLEKGVGGSRAA